MIDRDSITEGLNPEQIAAVTTIDGPLLVIAGAGSGKTRVITRRIAWIVAEGRPAASILAVTFTNKAAKEMAMRVDQLLGPTRAQVSTFHSFGVRLLRQEAARFGMTSSFTLYDRSDTEALLKACTKELALDADTYSPGRCLERISRWKSNLILPEGAAEEASTRIDENDAKLYLCYEDALKRAQALDFDDLLSKTVHLLQTHEDLLQAVRMRFRYVLVDEYQDVNFAQYRLTRLLGDGHGNVCVTGDPDQCIYSWRGARISYILDFPKYYANAKVVRLEHNYRSTNTILEAASHVIKYNTQRGDKELYSDLGRGEPIVIRRVASDFDEARACLDRILTLRQKGARWSDIAVFFRLNSLSYPVEQMLIAHRVPYHVLNGLEFFRRKEVKDVLAYLRFLVNRDDEVSLRRIINVPARQIGDKTVDLLLDIARESRLSLGATLLRPDLYRERLTSRAFSAVEKWNAIVADLERLRQGSRTGEFIRNVVEISGFAASLIDGGKTSGLDPLGNIEQLIGAAVRYDGMPNAAGLEGFLEDVALQSETDGLDAELDKVVLMTVHSAKGLEFPHVVVVGMDKDIFPHSRTSGTADIEEERRLFYVALTRAMKSIHLLTTCSRTRFGRTQPSSQSIFLEEIPEELSIVVDDAGGRSSSYSRSNISYDSDDEEDGPNVRRGSRVSHKEFGYGIVEKIQGRGPDARITVEFEESGRRILVWSYARLRVLDEEA